MVAEAVVSWQPVQELLVSSWMSYYSSFTNFLFTADPLLVCSALVVFFALLCFILGFVTDNYSWVDKLWSLTPWFYAWVFFSRVATNPENPGYQRSLIMAVLPTLWGLRLSFNFWRKGGYKMTGEDYRWLYIRDFLHPVLMQLMNFFFIACYQHVLLFAIALPAYIAYLSPSVPLNTLDYVAAGGFIFFFLVESASDQQQWNFQTKKYELLAANKNDHSKLTGDYKRGFLTSGLFSFSRHPNFFSEQMIWWSYYLFSVAASGQWLHWTIFGVVNLSLLFQGSTEMTERISISKYPEYKEYQKTTSRLLPWFPTSSASKRD